MSPWQWPVVGGEVSKVESLFTCSKLLSNYDKSLVHHVWTMPVPSYKDPSAYKEKEERQGIALKSREDQKLMDTPGPSGFHPCTHSGWNHVWYQGTLRRECKGRN